MSQKDCGFVSPTLKNGLDNSEERPGWLVRKTLNITAMTSLNVLKSGISKTEF